MKEIFFVADIETSGAIPGDHEMLTMGCQVVADGTVQKGQDFYAALKWTAKNQDGDTMEWWADIHTKTKLGTEAYLEAFIREPRYEPREAMIRFDQWVKDELRQFDAKHAVFVSRPTGFDFTFVRWYLTHFVGSCIFGHRALDLRSLWMGRIKGSGTFETPRPISEMGQPVAFSDLDSSKMDAAFGAGYVNPLPHHALEDAKALANAFVNVLSKVG
mgnify:CR=1 FL=1